MNKHEKLYPTQLLLPQTMFDQLLTVSREIEQRNGQAARPVGTGTVALLILEDWFRRGGKAEQLKGE